MNLPSMKTPALTLGQHQSQKEGEKGTSMAESSSNMPNLTLGYGLFLMVWGVGVSVLSDSDSITSYFPSFLGVPIAVSGWLAKTQPEKRKLWMHIAVTFGLLCALGGTRFFMVMGDGIDYASGSMLMLLLTGSVYTALCVRSFIAARKAREAAQE
ncbi:MAG: hypothetical protein DWC07_06700 [Candidatus Poseidoniales archaeon]|nr:MAG: hypothetical protein DWC07_06700 [Candidatus Poseidoniales archaeon]